MRKEKYIPLATTELEMVRFMQLHKFKSKDEVLAKAPEELILMKGFSNRMLYDYFFKNKFSDLYSNP